VASAGDASNGETASDSISVLQSYFLASHIAARLEDASSIPDLTLEHAFQFLGRVQLDGITAPMLRQMLDSGRRRDVAYSTRKACGTICRFLATEGGCQVFAKPIRYLFENLEALGYLRRDKEVL